MGNVTIDSQGNAWETTVTAGTIEEGTIHTSGFMQVINMLPVKIKKLEEDAKVPTRGSAAAAGYDLYAVLPGLYKECGMDIAPHTTLLVGTGLAFQIPNGTFLGLYPRSGLASKKGLRPANCVGVVDSDYRGEVKVALHNDTDVTQHIENGERIAQAILQNYMPMSFEEVDELDDTDRGQNGFGSTGNK